MVLCVHYDKEKKMADAAANEQQLKQRAMRRLAIALGLIAVAVVGLAVLDRYSGSSQPTQAGGPRDEPPAVASLPPPRPIAPPPQSTDPALPPPPPPKVDDDDSSGIPDAPGSDRVAARATAAPSAASAPPPAAAPPSTADPATPPQPSAQTPVPAAAPSPAPGAAPARKEPSAPAPTPGYVVQLGMFSSVENAQALLERLRAQGVPAYLETRVVVGPFRDKAEADAAQRKLQAGGVAGVIAQRK